MFLSNILLKYTESSSPALNTACNTISSENGVKEIPKKSKPRSQTSKKANGSPAKKHTSKYFQDQLMKEEREAMSVDAEDDDFTTPTVSVASGAKKTETKKEDEDDECEDDSDEDGDWEEVEG